MTTTEAPEATRSSINGPIRDRAVDLINKLLDVAGDESAIVDILRPEYDKGGFDDLVLAALVLSYAETLEADDDQPDHTN